MRCTDRFLLFASLFLGPIQTFFFLLRHLILKATYSRFCLIRSGFPPVIIIDQDYVRFAPFLVVVLAVVVVGTCVCVVGMIYGGTATLIDMFIF